MPTNPPIDVTLHLTVPRQLWSDAERPYAEDEPKVKLGDFLVGETREGLARLRGRNGAANYRPHVIEITLTDTARAEIEADPDAHTP